MDVDLRWAVVNTGMFKADREMLCTSEACLISVHINIEGNDDLIPEIALNFGEELSLLLSDFNKGFDLRALKFACVLIGRALLFKLCC